MKKLMSTIVAASLLCTAAIAKSPKNSDQNKSDCVFEFGTDVSARFTGTVYFKNLVHLDNTFNFPESNVITFAPDSRSSWHVHGGMYVIGVGGVGLYQEKGKDAIIIRKGDVVQIPAGVEHWHGSTKDSWFQQIVVYDKNWKPAEGADSHAGGEVTAEEFAKIKMVEKPNRAKKTDKKLMFARGKKLLKLPTFNKGVYLSDIVGAQNEARSPGMHYVVFPTGTYNAWHTHKGGQILIATDGIGFHQIEGQEVQVLKPGDVALCPPGVKHWHGGSLAGTFAHIATNTNPDRPGVEWFEMIDKEVYNNLPKE
ncbi:MAG: cupin domain-containing protein [Treponema sp.]|nr:cupin domain-containing protein [Treponema sp.]